jgi:methionine aminopeptidase
VPAISCSARVASGCRPLREGDIINIDVTVFLNGYHGDTSRTFYVGKPSPNAQRLVEATEEALQAAIKVTRKNCDCFSTAAFIVHWFMIVTGCSTSAYYGSSSCNSLFGLSQPAAAGRTHYAS